MDSEYLCKHLIKLTSVLNGVPIEDCFSRRKKDGLYVFGQGEDINYITKQMAIFIVLTGKQERGLQVDNITQDKIKRPPSTDTPKQRVHRRRRY